MELKYIHESENKTKLKYVLRDKLYISNVLLKKLKDVHAIYLNSDIGLVNKEVVSGDIVKVDLDKIPQETSSVIPTKHNLDILYEDEYILIVNKPYGTDIHPCMANFSESLANYVMHYYKEKNYNISKVHIITRLDKNTSGVCLIAKNEYVQELFLRRKDEISLKKEYILACYGIIQDTHFVIEKNIERKPGSIILRQVSNTSGEYAKTEVFLENVNKERNYSICKVILHTGRTHQIRVHFLSINHPLLGDDLYTENLTFHDDIMRYINRQALHSYRLTFNHPITNKHIVITADIPEDIKKLQ